MQEDRCLIVALDVPTAEQARQLVESLEDKVGYYKVGMELFYHTGHEIISYLRHRQKDVFLDLKMHDIPNTVAQGAAALTSLGVSMMTFHAAGGGAMMKAAVQAVQDTAQRLAVKRPRLIAVTVLTSINAGEWQALGYSRDIARQAVQWAKLAQASGMDGVVASPQEAENIRKECGPEFLIVTPGIRPAGNKADDQSRIATPAGALAKGASHLVIGRPITQAANPQQAAAEILQEMRQI